MKNENIKFMKMALKEAAKAGKIDEVPVGAVIVFAGKVIAKAYNKKEKNNDPLGHAELLAIKKASKKLNTWRLNECILYVTLEPCAMCAGAIMWSRFQKVVFGAYDEKGGAMGRAFNLFNEKIINHTPLIEGGIMEQEAKEMLQSFFRAKRNKKETA